MTEKGLKIVFGTSEGGKQGMTHDRDIDKILLCHSLGIDFLEKLDGLLTCSLDLGWLSQKADAEIIMDLNGLVRIRTMGIVGNDIFGIGQVQLLKGELHECNSPSDEGVEISKRLLGVFHGAIDVEGAHVGGVGAVGDILELGYVAES